MTGRENCDAGHGKRFSLKVEEVLELTHCLVITTNHRRTIATAISDAAIIRITSNCSSNDPDIANSAGMVVVPSSAVSHGRSCCGKPLLAM
jgi:hypothetical protein